MKLRLLELKDADGMLEWMHDPKINCYFRFDAAGMTKEKVLAFIKHSIELAKERKSFHLAITEEDEYLGTISLKNIDWERKEAEYAISTRSVAQGKGIATEATKEILRYAHVELGLNRVFLNVLSDNEKAISLYEKCGFRYEGMCKETVCINGEMKFLRLYAITLDK